MVQGFKKFLFRGNVVDLAVAVVIGAAFGAVITSLVTNIFTPLIAAIAGKPDLAEAHLILGQALIEDGQTDKARRHLEQAVRLSKPGDTEAQTALERLRQRVVDLPGPAAARSAIGFGPAVGHCRHRSRLTGADRRAG